MIVGRGGVLFMPQRPYIVEGGSLRDQLLYPDSPGRQACTDARVQTDNACGATSVTRAHTVLSVCLQLLEILSTLDLAFLSARKGGLDAMEDWANMLSGGEQQRLGFARLFYHRYVCRRCCDHAGVLMHVTVVFVTGPTLQSWTSRRVPWMWHWRASMWSGELCSTCLQLTCVCVCVLLVGRQVHGDLCRDEHYVH